ncbi:pyrophosphatase [Aureococcus anophagefferens]|nr:pyrophosphatase [Aureococcus anophagefferens]
MLAERLLARAASRRRGTALAFAAVAVDCRGFAGCSGPEIFAAHRASAAVLDALGGGPAPDGSAPALRGRALPAACAVLGAATVGDLAKRLLAARKDVSALEAPQLLRLDYKRASAGRLRVGAASIMAPLSDFSRRAALRAPLSAGAPAAAASTCSSR